MAIVRSRLSFGETEMNTPENEAMMINLLQGGQEDLALSMLDQGLFVPMDAPAWSIDGGAPFFHLAARHAAPRVLMGFIRCGVDPRSRDPSGNTALFGAHAESIKTLLQLGLKTEDLNYKGQTALLYLCQNLFGRDTEVDAARELLRLGASVNARDEQHATPIMIAAASKQLTALAVTEVLIEARANLQHRTLTGANALVVALTQSKDPARVRSLLAGGAKFDPDSGQWEEAVTLSVSKQASPGLVLHMIEREGLDPIGHRFPNGDTLLHKAFANNVPSIALCLLEHGADARAKNTRGKSVFSLRIGAPECAVVMQSFLTRQSALSALNDLSHERASNRMAGP